MEKKRTNAPDAGPAVTKPVESGPGAAVTAIAKAQPAAIVGLGELPINFETVRKFICPDATDQEILLFAHQCKSYKLDPFTREIYLIKYGGEKAQAIVGYEEYLKRADRTKNWAGLETGVELTDVGLPRIAWAKVYRRDWTAPLYHEVHYTEYLQTRRDKQDNKIKPTRFWREKPITMLKKVAVAQAMRMAFPTEFGGLPYIEEELHLERPEPGSFVKPATAKLEELKAEIAKPAADPEREAYEKMKASPLPRVKDEFDQGGDAPNKAAVYDNGDDPQGVGPEPAAGQAAPLPLKTLERFAKILAELKAYEIPEATIWEGIQRFALRTFKRPIVELNDCNAAEAEQTCDYLHRWKKAHEAELEKAKKGGDNGHK
jgi:phage recombination protein Bet